MPVLTAWSWFCKVPVSTTWIIHCLCSLLSGLQHNDHCQQLRMLCLGTPPHTCCAWGPLYLHVVPGDPSTYAACASQEKPKSCWKALHSSGGCGAAAAAAWLVMRATSVSSCGWMGECAGGGRGASRGELHLSASCTVCCSAAETSFVTWHFGGGAFP